MVGAVVGEVVVGAVVGLMVGSVVGALVVGAVVGLMVGSVVPVVGAAVGTHDHEVPTRREP
jgi:hypothetical protein